MWRGSLPAHDRRRRRSGHHQREPNFWPPGTTIVIDGSYLNLVSELVIGGVDVNEVPASDLQYGPGFYLRSDHVIVASTPSPKYSGSPVSVTGTDTAGNTVATSATYTYPIGLLSMTGPLPYTPGQIGDQPWANGQGRSLSLYPDKQLQFTTSAPLFHITTSFTDDSATYPENPPSSHHAPYAIGNEGQFTAVLEMCSLTASASNTASSEGGLCTNWDGNTGYWVDAGSVDNQLPIEQHSTLIANGGTAIGDIALATTGLFDQQNYARTFRVYAFVTETDTHTAALGDQRTDCCTLSARFTAVVSPEALVQLNVLPYTILYQPPGDLSTVSYAVGSNYGTTFTLGNSNAKTETGTTEESSSLKFSEALSFLYGYSLSSTGTLDHTDTQGYGVTGNTSTTVSQNIAQGDTITTGPDLNLVPGDGNLCLSATNCPTNGPYTQVTNMVSHEPFWDDEFVLLVHPQFAIYDIGQGQYTDVYYGAEPVTATIPVASLDACARGIPSPYQGQDPCSASYSDTTLIAPASGVVYQGSANTVELSADEASSLLKLDPFYEGGQGADLPPTRALPIKQEPYGSYYGFGEKPYTVMHTYTNTQASATTTGQQTVSSSSVTDVVGNDFNAGFSAGMSGSTGEGAPGVAGSEGLTLDNADKVTYNTMVSTTFSDSTAVSQQESTTATVTLNDVDNTTPGITPTCVAKCHGPLPGRPSTVVFLDREFGSFMFQDARAPGAATCPVCGHLQSLSATEVAGVFASHEVGLDQAREQFSDVLPTSRDDAAIAFLVADHAMNTYGKAFRPASPVTQGMLATLIGEVARVTAGTALEALTTGGASREVTAGELESVISRVFKVPAPGAAAFEEAGYGVKTVPVANSVVTRAEAAATVFASLQARCLTGCHLLVAPAGTSPGPGTGGVPSVLDPHAASFGATAADAAGALYVTWLRNSNPGTDMFCKIPSGGTCTDPVVLPLPSGGALAETDQPFPVLAPGGVVYVVAGRYIDDDVVVWTSTDGGHLFGAPTVIAQGSFPNKTNVDDVLLATRTYEGGTSRLGSSFLMSSTHVGLGFGLVTCVCTRPAEPTSSFSFSGLSTTQNVSSLSSSLALDANGGPVEAFSTSAIAPTVGFYRYSGSGAIGTQQSWSGPTTVAQGYLARLAGGPAGLFLLSEDRAPGSAAITEVDIRKYDPAAHVFGAPKALVDEPFAEPDVGGALYENQKTGALAVAWPQFSASGKAVMQLWTSTTGGKSWSGPTDIATIAFGYAQADNARLAVADNGQVSLTFLDGNGLELVSMKPS